MMRVMSSVGNPTDVSTITMVTSPACGMPAAPMLAAVAVMLGNIWKVSMTSACQHEFFNVVLYVVLGHFFLIIKSS